MPDEAATAYPLCAISPTTLLESQTQGFDPSLILHSCIFAAKNRNGMRIVCCMSRHDATAWVNMDKHRHKVA